jgi:hypothetical protein
MIALAMWITAISQPVKASQTVPVSPNPTLLESTQALRLVDNTAGITEIPMIHPEALTSVTAEYSWLRAYVDGDKLVLDYDVNPNSGDRLCKVTFARTGYTSQVMTVTQPGDPFAATLAALVSATEYVKPSSSYASSYNTNPYRGIELSYDDDLNTAYHSSFSGFQTTDESSWPILIYYFENSFELGYINYIPPTGNGNGSFGLVDIWTRSDGSDEYAYLGLYDFGNPTTTKTLPFPEELSHNVNAVKFRVRSGKHHSGGTNAFAACREMQFAKRTTMSSDTAVFADDVYSSIKPDVTLADIEGITNPMLKELAMRLYRHEYDATGRVVSIEPRLSTSVHQGLIKSYGAYDQYQGATGIMLGKGTNVVIVSGIPDSKGSMTLVVRGWKPTSDSSESYTLRNGVNVIEKTTNWNGLAYLSNYNTMAEMESTAATVKLHFVNGAVNGVLRPTLSNEENQAILDHACHGVIDLMGNYAHGIWQTESVKQYTKGKYVMYMNLIDQLIIWMHRQLGIEKYGYEYGNTTLAYCCNWNYMTQTGTGIAMNISSDSRLLSPDALMYTDSDAIWGFSHEWGHQHQMNPYFQWPTTWEVTNNICSIYNFLRMGYTDRVENSRKNAVNIVLNDNHTKTTSDWRQKAIDEATSGTALDWCPALKEWAAQQSATITKYADDKDHAITIMETDGSYYMMMFYMLMDYFCEAQSEDYRPAEDYIPDYSCDFFQSMRSTSNTEGSTVEKSSIDKYELIAHAQNGSAAKFNRLKELYPESCWVTKGYLDGTNKQLQNEVPYVLNYIRKASVLCGYNLVPYFERWGLLRSVAMYAPDYASSWYLMPEDMLEEFRTDMANATDRDGNPLKTIDDDFVMKISNAPIPQYAKPTFPNDHAITADEVKTVLK